MNLKRLIAGTLAVSMVMISSVYASEEKLVQISDTGVISISGKTEELPGTKITYIITRPGYDRENFESVESANEAIEEIYQDTVKEDCTFSYTYPLSVDAKSGNYSIYVNVYGEDEKREQKVYFKNTANLTEAVRKINEGESVKDVIEKYMDDIDYETGLKYLNATAEQRDYVNSAIKSLITEEELVNSFKEYTDIAMKLLSNPDIEKQDFKDAIENQHEKLGISDADYEKYDSLSNAKKEVVVVYMADNYSGTKSMHEFISLYNNAIIAAQKNNKPSNSGGSGGGGGGSSSGGFIAAPVTSDNNKFELDPSDIGESFDDIDEAPWAKDAINKLAGLGIVNGKSEKIFAPNDNVTREEFVSIIVRAFQLTKSDKEAEFSDVNKDAWYYKSVKTAFSSGIINGMGDGKFGIGQQITRQDMAVIISRAVEVSGLELYTIYPDKTLNDLDLVSDYAKDAVGKMIKAGVINGNDAGDFMLTSKATRAQAAQIIYNILFK